MSFDVDQLITGSSSVVLPILQVDAYFTDAVLNCGAVETLFVTVTVACAVDGGAEEDAAGTDDDEDATEVSGADEVVVTDDEAEDGTDADPADPDPLPDTDDEQAAPPANATPSDDAIKV